MASVRWERALKAFAEVVALDELTLDVSDGEFLVLLGPSGSGKTTALRLVAGLEGLSGGHVWIGSRQVDELSPKDRGIAMVFQDYALYPQMTVFGNLAFGLRLAHVPRDEVRMRVTAAAEMLGLGDLLGRKPGALSGGQRQRVALGRAIVREPDVLLMDEPLSNLDAQLRTQMRKELMRVRTETGRTTIYVTHDQVEAMTMGDRVAVLRDGRLEQCDTPERIYRRPRNVFVAGFVGSPGMAFNLFGVSYEGTDGVFRRGALELRWPNCAASLPDEVMLGTRPEHVRLWEDGRRLVGPIVGRVESFEALGRETFAEVATAEGANFVVQWEAETRPRPKETIRFGFEPSRAHLFETTTSEAISSV